MPEDQKLPEFFWKIGMVVEDLIDDGDMLLLQDFERQYQDYLNGHWTKEPPEDAGLYPAVPLDGLGVVFKHFPARDTRWRGWFWSRPVPWPPAFLPEVEGE